MDTTLVPTTTRDRQPFAIPGEDTSIEKDFVLLILTSGSGRRILSSYHCKVSFVVVAVTTVFVVQITLPLRWEFTPFKLERDYDKTLVIWIQVVRIVSVWLVNSE